MLREAERTLDRLSTRERQIIAAASLGKSNKEIACELGLAHATVRVLLARAARKLGATGRRDLLEWLETNSDAHDASSQRRSG